MKNSIGYQLFTRGLIVFLFIFLMAVAGQICISFLKRTSNKVFVEYTELDAIQEYRNRLNNVVINFDSFKQTDNSKTRDNFEKSIQDCMIQLEKCEDVITHRHDRTLLTFFRNELTQLDSIKNILFTGQPNPEELNHIQNSIIQIVYKGTKASEKLLLETKIEIEEFIVKNKIAVVHSTITIIVAGIILLLIVTIGGIRFINKLTSPISTLLASTKKVGKGEFETIVQIDTNNEFKELAESFNEMIKTLEKTTVSRDYYDNILKNMIEPLIVTDSNGNIKTVNDITKSLLEFNFEELLDSNISKLFLNNENINDSNLIFKEIKQGAVSKSERIFLTKNGHKIPVTLSTSVINNNNGEVFQYIFVAHDLTEKKEAEKKLEIERKEKLIAINDAHEEEKFRIAIELHDGLGQILTATSYAFQNFFGEQNTENSEYQKNVNFIQSQLDIALSESKVIAHNLIPLALKDFGLLVAAKNLIEQANQRSDINFSFEAFNCTSRINRKLEKAIFRIFQEAVSNIIKHSKAKNASFQINKYDDAIVVAIEDDGIGFDINKKTSSNKLNGIGLIGMRERILAFDGSFIVNTQPNAGTEILIEIPCQKKVYGSN